LRVKQLINPYVAIELGYALAKLTGRKLLMVLNTAFGSREGLPFDIQHRAGPILYRLPADATENEIRSESGKLVHVLVEALRPYISIAAESERLFDEAASTSSRAFFSQPGETLAEVGEPSDLSEFTIEHGPAFYLRIIPSKELTRPLTITDGVGALSRIAGCFGDSLAGIEQQNSYGITSFNPRRPNIIGSLVQLFRNGEVWGINVDLLERGAERSRPPLVPSFQIERTLYNGIRSFSKFIATLARSEPPFTVEAGIVGVQGWTLLAKGTPGAQYVGELHRSPISVRRRLKEMTDENMDTFLLEFFRKVFDQTGHARPDGLYGFPGPQAY
jgi:hypothetical protein